MKDVFCKIIDRDIPSAKIYEDDDVLAILDISQVTKGHALVIPKEHYDNFLSCPTEIMHKCMSVAQCIGKAQTNLLHAEGINVLTNVGETAGQTVIHFHIHVIPRYSKDEDGLSIVMKEQDASNMDLPSLAALISNELK